MSILFCITVIEVSVIEITSFCSYIYTFLANRCFFAISVAYVVLQQLVWFAYLSGLDCFKMVKYGIFQNACVSKNKFAFQIM